MNDLIYKSIQLLKSKTSVKIVNYLTNNNDLIYICPHLYLGNINSAHHPELLTQFNIQSIVNCTNDVEFHSYFNNKSKSKYRVNIEDSKNNENIEDFKMKIIQTVNFIDNQINNNNNVMVHCYWGLMRSPTVIASYLIYKYNMNVEDAIQFIKNKKNFTFNNSYNFKEILNFIKEEFNRELIFENNLNKIKNL